MALSLLCRPGSLNLIAGTHVEMRAELTELPSDLHVCTKVEKAMPRRVSHLPTSPCTQPCFLPGECQSLWPEVTPNAPRHWLLALDLAVGLGIQRQTDRFTLFFGCIVFHCACFLLKKKNQFQVWSFILSFAVSNNVLVNIVTSHRWPCVSLQTC